MQPLVCHNLGHSNRLLETVWRVEKVPGQTLSVMAHVLGSDGRAAAVGDGLGVPIESWQPGDVFAAPYTDRAEGYTARLVLDTDRRVRVR